MRIARIRMKPPTSPNMVCGAYSARREMRIGLGGVFEAQQGEMKARCYGWRAGGEAALPANWRAKHVARRMMFLRPVREELENVQGDGGATSSS